MFIPIGLDEAETRRTPWVSLVLIAINVLVFAVVSLGGSQAEIEQIVEARGREVVSYLREHPYLELPASNNDIGRCGVERAHPHSFWYRWSP